MSRIFLKRHSIIRHASYMSRIFLKRHSIIRHASVVITSCCDFYQEKQRGRDRAPVLSSEDYTIVITALNSHSPDSSHKEKLLYGKEEAFIHRQNMSLILFTCVLCTLYLLMQKLIEPFCYRTGIILFSIVLCSHAHGQSFS